MKLYTSTDIHPAVSTMPSRNQLREEEGLARVEVRVSSASPPILWQTPPLALKYLHHAGQLTITDWHRLGIFYDLEYPTNTTADQCKAYYYAAFGLV